MHKFLIGDCHSRCFYVTASNNCHNLETSIDLAILKRSPIDETFDSTQQLNYLESIHNAEQQLSDLEVIPKENLLF